MALSPSPHYSGWRQCAFIPANFRKRRYTSNRRRYYRGYLFRESSFLAALQRQRNITYSINSLPAVRAHNKLRFERVSCAQKLGFANAFLLHHTDWDGAKKDPGKAQPNIPQWIWRHDPKTYAQERWQEVQAYVVEGGLDRESRGEESTFKNTNIPPGFKWSPWTLDELVYKGKLGQVNLEGDWS